MVPAQLAGAVEYIDCILCRRIRPLPPNKSPGYDIKQSGSTWKGPIYDNANILKNL